MMKGHSISAMLTKGSGVMALLDAAVSIVQAIVHEGESYL